MNPFEFWWLDSEFFGAEANPYQLFDDWQQYQYRKDEDRAEHLTGEIIETIDIYYEETLLLENHPFWRFVRVLQKFWRKTMWLQK